MASSSQETPGEEAFSQETEAQVVLVREAPGQNAPIATDEAETTFTIAEMASRTGLTYDTLRYYEKLGLLPSVKRNDNGQREYDNSDLGRLMFITRLRYTNMPLKEIERYISLASKGEYERCLDILYEHQKSIASQMEEMQATLDLVHYKIDHFKELMTRSGLRGEPVYDVEC